MYLRGNEFTCVYEIHKNGCQISQVLIITKMPRNFTGGKGHRSGQNSESAALNKNKKLFEDFIDDIRKGEDLDGIFIGRVTRKFGDGRTEVVYFHEDRMYTVQALS